MKPNGNLKDPVKAASRARTRRFRIDRLEERIAPKKGGGGNTRNCTANCASVGSGSSSY